jgi:hypothetical protein
MSLVFEEKLEKVTDEFMQILRREFPDVRFGSPTYSFLQPLPERFDKAFSYLSPPEKLSITFDVTAT